MKMNFSMRLVKRWKCHTSPRPSRTQLSLCIVMDDGVQYLTTTTIMHQGQQWPSVPTPSNSAICDHQHLQLPASTPSVAASMLKPKIHSRCPLAIMATTSLHSQYVTPSVASDSHCLQVSAYYVHLCDRHRLLFSMELC